MLSDPVISDFDPWTDDALLDPYPMYRAMRSLGPAIWLERYRVFALPRFHGVREALRNWRVYSSAQGVGMDEEQNAIVRGGLLTSDGPEHVAIRTIVGRPLAPQAMAALRGVITAEAERVAERVIQRGAFDGVSELAWHLPLAVVSQLVGLPEEGRSRMLEWGAAGFNATGPSNERARAGAASRVEMLEYLRTQALPGKLLPNSWGAQLYEAAERGEIPVERCPREMANYVGPSLDTTINAISSALWLFTQHPDQWDAIRADSALIPNAMAEVLRCESPLQFFTRVVTADVNVDDTIIPAKSRVMIMYGSANRDERHWEDADRFDILRNAKEQLAFGHGAHVCLGMHLAKLEMESLFKELAKRVKRFELDGHPERSINNSLRGFRRLQLIARPA